MYDLVLDNKLDLEALRAKLRHMSDEALNHFGRAARYMCSPAANHGRRPRRVFIVPLKEAVGEWRRRRRPRGVESPVSPQVSGSRTLPD